MDARFLLALAPGWMPRGWAGKTATLSMLNIGLFFPLLFVAAYRLPGGVAAIVGAAQPLVVAVLVGTLNRGVVSRRQVQCCVLALGGIALTTLTGRLHVDAWGLLAAAGATVSMATGTVLTRRWGTPAGHRPLTMTIWQLLIGGVVLLPLIPVIDRGPWHPDAAAIGGYAWLAVMGGALAYALWFAGARTLPSTNVALLGVLSPLTAAALGWLVLDQSLTALQATGFGLALLGAVAGQSRPSLVTASRSSVSSATEASMR